MSVAQPDYELITSEQNIEIRRYSPLILAEIEVLGERKQAIRAGFTVLANYLFGQNYAGQKMEMTAPVLQEGGADRWKVRFVMSKKYTLETLPQPISKEVAVITLPARYVAVIRFSGVADEESLKQHTEVLQTYMAAQQLTPISGIMLAFYHPPWTPPSLRRNEIMTAFEENSFNLK